MLHPDRRAADLALSAAFEALKQVEQVMSLYLPDSQLSRLNRDGPLSDPHPYLVDVLLRSRAMSLASSGAFDVTLQPLWELHAEAKKSGRLPAGDEQPGPDVLPLAARLSARGKKQTKEDRLMTGSYIALREQEPLRKAEPVCPEDARNGYLPESLK